MTGPNEATIVPIEITLDGKRGVTLWAPPWEEDGDEWQAFLGSGEKLELFADSAGLAAYIARSGDNDLVDHPAWDMVQTLPPDQLRPEDDYHFDLDAVLDLIDGSPTDDAISELADTIDMVQRIAECVDDGPLMRMLEGPIFATLIDDDEPSYDDEDWEEAQTTIARAWPLVTARLQACLHWNSAGEVDGATSTSPANFWDEIGILPLSVTVPAGTGYTLRCYLDDSAIFLGSDLTVDIFRSPRGLIEYCRTDDAHDLAELDTWTAVRNAAVLDVSPASGERYNLTSDTSSAREIATDLADYCQLAGVQEILDGTDKVGGWDSVVTELSSCLRWHD
ncbi:MAG TPA: hypothetical protein VHX59_14185 [Mycobacteriales bacterium]|jgi:hypothetical protein|nr:hypothetical protein [Mycobacteriales bacterium]